MTGSLPDPDRSRDLPRQPFLALGIAAIWFLIYIVGHEALTAGSHKQRASEVRNFHVPDDVAASMPEAAFKALGKSFDRGSDLLGKCLICHDVSADDVDRKRFGPSLAGLFVDGIGIKDYEYSPVLKSMQEKGRPWSVQSLWAFIHKPDGFAKGTRMPFPGIDDQKDIRDLLHYFAWSCGTNCQDPVIIRIETLPPGPDDSPDRVRVDCRLEKGGTDAAWEYPDNDHLSIVIPKDLNTCPPG